jgi:23S rRNA (uracil1939-C5)-methyltransferase
MTARYRPGDVITLEVTRQLFGAEAFARIGGLAVFVSDAVAGDTVSARVTSVKKNFIRAEAVEIITPSSTRVEPICPIADECGGCQWQQIGYDAQLVAKEDAVRDSLMRIGKLDNPLVRAIIPSPNSLAHRNKATYDVAHLSGVRIGYHARKSDEIVPVSRCPVNLPGLDAALSTAVELLSDPRWSGFAESLDSLSGRQSLATGQVVIRLRLHRQANAALFARELTARCSQITGITVRGPRVGQTPPKERTLVGASRLVETVGDHEYDVTASSFFQTNPHVAPLLVDEVRTACALTGSETLLDAYGGAGLFAFALAGDANRVDLVESAGSAVADAKRIAESHDNVYVHRAPVERPPMDMPRPDVIVCDPPREGMSRDAMEVMMSAQATRFVYVSCDPTCLARDSVTLGEYGYRLEYAQPLDMFPHTYHVETVALFVKQD